MATKPGKTFDEFRTTHDRSLIIPKRIKAALAELGDSWEYEQEFLRRVGCSITEFSRYRTPYMADHVVELNRQRSNGTQAKRVWCGTKAMAAKVRAVAEAQ